MSTAVTTIPITVTPEARDFVRVKGYEHELEQILGHTMQTIPGLRSLRVIREINFTHEGDLGVTLEAVCDPEVLTTEKSPEWDWSRWLIAHYPPEVAMHFHFMSYEEENHGR
jgi:hypothetical protein